MSTCKKWWSCASVLVALCFGTQAALAHDSDDLRGPLVLKDAGSFFVGGTQKVSDAISGIPEGPAAGGYPNTDVITVDQMYVQFQVPMRTSGKIPIVMIHGCCLSAKSWEDTPDGRMGWYEYFVRKNHAVYLPDQSSRARSGFDVTSINEVKLGLKPASQLPNVWRFGRNSAWDVFRFGPRYPEVWPGQQFPVEAIGEFAKQVVPDLNATLPDPNPTYANLAQTAVIAGGAVVVGHSESGPFPMLAALADPKGIRGMIAIEGYCPAMTPEQINKLAKIPLLFVYGDYLAGSDYSGNLWPVLAAGCQGLANQVKAAGGNVQFWNLPSLGLNGNSHMLMMDRNNLQIADMVLAWIEKNVNQRHGPRLVGKNRHDAD